MHKYYIMFLYYSERKERYHDNKLNRFKEIDFTKQELEELIDLSIKFKQLKKERIA